MSLPDLFHQLPEGVKEQALKALGQMGVSLAKSGWGAARAERKRLQKEQDAIRGVMLEAIGKKLGEMAIADTDFMMEQYRNTLGRDFRRQDNVDEVAAQFAEQLLLPSPAAEPPAEESTPKQISDDWLNMFSRYAEDASTEQMQQLMGRILAGEVRRPGSFAPSTIRAMAELDDYQTNLLMRLSKVRVGNFVPTSKVWNEGELYDFTQNLISSGYVTNSVGGTTNTFALNENGTGGFFLDGEYGLSLTGAPNSKVQWPILGISRIAMQMLNLLEKQNPLDVIRDVIVNANFKEKCSSCSIIKKNDSGGVTFIEVVFDKRDRIVVQAPAAVTSWSPPVVPPSGDA